MCNSLRRWVVPVVAVVLVGGVLASVGQAAPPVRRSNRSVVVVPVNQHINPNYMIAPGLSLQQYAYNVSVLGRAYSNVPPYLLGYSPSVYSMPYTNPYYYSAYSPYLLTPFSNPYMGLYYLP